MAFSLDSKVKEILKDPRACEVLDKYAPGASKNPQMKLDPLPGSFSQEKTDRPRAVGFFFSDGDQNFTRRAM